MAGDGAVGTIATRGRHTGFGGTKATAVVKNQTGGRRVCVEPRSGTVNPVRDMTRLGPMKREPWSIWMPRIMRCMHPLTRTGIGCDFLACSAYKFFGPHLGILWGKRNLLDELEAYKVRPAPLSPPDKWMTGTQNHEAIAGGAGGGRLFGRFGTDAGGDESLSRRAALQEAYREINDYERSLASAHRWAASPKFRT